MTAYPGNLFHEEKDLARAEQDGVEFFKFLGVSSLEEARNLDAVFSWTGWWITKPFGDL